ncbi:MAG: phage tail protein [Clostridium sp.]
MYQVTIFNENEPTIINSVTVEYGSNRLDGSFKEGINSIDSFSFNILPCNTGYELIKPLTTTIEVLNTHTNIVEFKGRVLLPIPSMSSSGEFMKKIICESELGYLRDSCTRYGEYHDISVKDFLKLIIDNHNKQTSLDKYFTVGEVTVKANLYRFLGHEKTFDSIKSNLLDRLGGELQVRHENGVRYLDYLIKRGQEQPTEIILSKNLISIEKEVDPTQVISRLVAYGAKKEDTEERISFKDINNGKDYLDDIEAIEEFGIIEDTILWDDVTIPENLLRKAQDKQKEVNKLLKKHKIEALDLSVIGLDIAGFNVCDSYKVINPVMDIFEVLRVIEKTTDINNPQNSSLTIGDKFDDIKSNQLKVNTTAKSVEKVKDTVNTTINIVGNVSTDLSNTVDVVNNTIDVLNSTNTNVSLINSSLIDVTTSLQANIKATNELVILTNSIAETLNNTNLKLEKLKRRTMLGV